VFLLPAAATLAAERPGLYRKHPDWTRTLGESRKALAEFGEELKRSELFATGVLRSSDAAKKIAVDVSRAEVLWLGTGDAGDGNGHDVGVWGSPVLIAHDGSRVPLVKLKPFVSEAGRGSAKLGKATIGKQAFADSISCHATGRIGYRLARRFKGFEASVGVAHNRRKRGTVTFCVSAHPNYESTASAARRMWERLGTDFPSHKLVFSLIGNERKCIDAMLLGGDTKPVLEGMEKTAGVFGVGPRDFARHDGLASCVVQIDQAARSLAACDTLKNLIAGLDVHTTEFGLKLAHLRRMAGGPGADAARDVEKLEARLTELASRLVAGADPDRETLLTLGADIGRTAKLLAKRSGWQTFRGDSARSAISFERIELPLKPCWVRKSHAGPKPAWPLPAAMNIAAPSGPLSATLTYDRAFRVVGVGDRLYYGSSTTDTVYCLDARTGAELWSFYTEGPVRLAPVVHGGSVYAGSDDGRIYCLDSSTGEARWTYDCATDDKKLPGNGRLISMQAVRGGMCVDGGVLYFTAGLFPKQGVHLVAIRTADGSELFRSKLGFSPQGYIAAGADHLVVPTGRTPAMLLDRKTGAHLKQLGNSNSWGKDLKGGSYAVTSEAGHVSGPSEDGHLHMFRPDGAGPVLRTPGLQCIPYGRRMLILSRNALAAANKRTYALEGRLAAEWKSPCPGARAMVVAGDVVFCATSGGVTAFDARTGKQLWQAPVEGGVEDLALVGGRLVAGTEKGEIHCFAPSRAGAQPRAAARNTGNSASKPASADAASARLAEALLAKMDSRRGYCLLVGMEDDGLARALSARSKLRIVMAASGDSTVAGLRKSLSNAEIYGTRVVVHRLKEGGPLPYRKQIFNLVVGGRGARNIRATEFARVLRPCGGLLAVDSSIRGGAFRSLRADQSAVSGKTVYVQGAIAGSGEWRHGYADPGNSACSGDELRFGPMSIQWFGRPGPRRMVDRHLKSPPPVYANGRLFVTGQDYITAIDAYNGTILWEKPLARSGRVAVMRDAANMVADERGVYVAHAGECSLFDAAKGDTLKSFKTSGPNLEWGYLALTDGVLIGSETRKGASFRPSETGTAGEKRKDITRISFMGDGPFACSRSLCGWDPESGRRIWRYSPKAGVIVNPAIACSGGLVCFVESSDPATQTARDGRLRVEALGKSARLVATEHRVVATSSRHARIGAQTRNRYDMQAFDLRTGKPVWRSTEVPSYDRETKGGHGELNQHPVIVGEVIYGPGYGRHLDTGAPYEGWKWHKGNKCATYSSSRHCAFSRFDAPKLPHIFDLASGKKEPLTLVSRPGCWINILPVGGMLVIPEASSGCTCGYSIQTSLALTPAE
jgi:outer membrane protein assembly factor BamB